MNENSYECLIIDNGLILFLETVCSLILCVVSDASRSGIIFIHVSVCVCVCVCVCVWRRGVTLPVHVPICDGSLYLC